MKIDPLWIEDFKGGVALHLPASKLPPTHSPRAWNTALSDEDGGTLLIGGRPGYQHVASVGSGSATLIGAALYSFEAGTTRSTHLIGVDADGNIWELKGTSTKISLPINATYGFPAAEAAGVTAGIQFVQANNQLFCWNRGGTPFKIYRTATDATLKGARIGLKAPPAPTYNSATVAGLCNGIFDFRVTFYNVNTGVESSASPDLQVDLVALGLTDKTIKLNLPATYPTDATHIRTYVRKQGLQTDFTRDASMEKTVGTATIDLSFDDAILNNHILFAPDQYQNNAPPTGIICAWWHLARMWVSDGALLYYSQVGNGDQYDPANFENPGHGDGQRTTALRSFAGDDTALIILKERSVWMIAGDTPQSWEMRQISATDGTISTLSVVEGDNLLGWWSENGPVVWSYREEERPRSLWGPVVEPLARAGTIQLNRRDICVGAYDPLGHRFLWTLDPVVATYPYKVLPWSTQLRTFEAIGWDLAPSFLVARPSSAGETRVLFGQGAHCYELAERLLTDGAVGPAIHTTVVSGTTGGCVLASAGPFQVNTRSSIARLIDLDTLQVHRSAYSLVGTALTWAGGSSFVPAAGSVVVFDAPVAEFDTAAIRPGTYDRRHRLLQLYVEMWGSSDGRALIGVYRDNEQLPRRVWSVIVQQGNILGTGSVLTGAVQRFKRWIGLLCLWHRVRVVFWDPTVQMKLARIGWTTDVQGDEE